MELAHSLGGSRSIAERLAWPGLDTKFSANSHTSIASAPFLARQPPQAGNGFRGRELQQSDKIRFLTRFLAHTRDAGFSRRHWLWFCKLAPPSTMRNRTNCTHPVATCRNWLDLLLAPAAVASRRSAVRVCNWRRSAASSASYSDGAVARSHAERYDNRKDMRKFVVFFTFLFFARRLAQQKSLQLKRHASSPSCSCAGVSGARQRFESV